MIQLYENVLTDAELEFINTTLSQSKWGYGFVSTDKNMPIWNFDKEAGEPIARLIHSKLNGYVLQDWHINGQTRCMDGARHTDNYNCTHSFVFFSQEWKFEYGGNLNLFPQNESPIIICPRKNIGVLFDSSIPHYAESVNYNFSLMRVSIGLKLNENRNM